MSNQYDALAKAIEASAESPLRKYFEAFTFFKALGDVTGSSVLDVACGTGLYSRRIKQRGASRVVGIDSSEPMLAYARQVEREAPLGIEYILQDAARAGELGVFDVVTATYLLHYASTKQERPGTGGGRPTRPRSTRSASTTSCGACQRSIPRGSRPSGRRTGRPT